MYEGRATGNIGIVGRYISEAPDEPGHIGERGRLTVQPGTTFEKGTPIRNGTVPRQAVQSVTARHDPLRAGRTGFLVSHRASLEDAPEMYERFDAREEGVTKVVLTP